MVFSQMATLTVNVAQRAVLGITSAPSENKRVRKISVHSDLVPLSVRRLACLFDDVIAFPEDNRSARALSSRFVSFLLFTLRYPRRILSYMYIHRFSTHTESFRCIYMADNSRN